jgi:hypothetical protein
MRRSILKPGVAGGELDLARWASAFSFSTSHQESAELMTQKYTELQTEHEQILALVEKLKAEAQLGALGLGFQLLDQCKNLLMLGLQLRVFLGHEFSIL